MTDTKGDMPIQPTRSAEAANSGSGSIGDRISLDDLAERLRPVVTDLENERKTVRTNVVKFACIGIGVGLVVALIFNLIGVHLVVSIMLLAVGVVAGVALAGWHAKRFKNRAASALAPPIAAAIGDITYVRAPGTVSEAEAFFQLKVVPNGNRIHYADCLRGRYRDTDFTLVECKIVRRSGTSSGGKSRSSSRTLFNGLLVRVSVPVAFDGTVFIGRDFGNLGNFLSGLIKKTTDLQPVAFPDSAFENHYEVYADDPDTARRLIDKGFANAMIRIDGLARGGRPRAAFADGLFYLALPWRGGFMEPVGVIKPIVLTQEWLGEMVDEMTLPHRLIDTLHGD